MKQTVNLKSIIVIAFLFTTTLFFAQSNNDIVKQVQGLLEENYIFLDKAKETNAHLNQLIKKGYFENKKPVDFATSLTKELRKITKDKHLRFSAPNRDRASKSKESSFTNYLSRYRAPMLRGFQLMDSNIGYIDLAFFGGAEIHLAKIDVAMKAMEAADAIIIDMRRNTGGSPTTVNYLSSYFFSEKLLLNTIYSRANDHSEEMWVTDVKGVKRPKVPVYILTSQSTFSGAEDFSYTMQSRGRATVIGEITGGGAHPTRGFPLDKGYTIGIPFARTINPVTKTNWEGVGVQPDIKMPAKNAMEKAKELALIKSKEYKDSMFKPLEKALLTLEKEKITKEKEDKITKQFEVLIKSNMLDEGGINSLGYAYIQQKKTTVASTIFKVNTILFPDSANTWDSLAESYLELNNKEKAIKYYNKAIKMDPEGDTGSNAKRMLKSIK